MVWKSLSKESTTDTTTRQRRSTDGDEVTSGELIPLTTDFDATMFGFDRRQVRHYVDSVEAEIRLLGLDRDSYAARADNLQREVERLQSSVLELRARIDRICRSPIEPSALRERTARMLELAEASATETVARANAATEHCWAAARQSAARLARSYQRLSVDMVERDRAVAAEHRRVIDEAHAGAEELTTRARERADELDARDAARRRDVMVDFELAVHHRRTEVFVEIKALRERSTAAARELRQTAENDAEVIRAVAETARQEVIRCARTQAARIIKDAGNRARAEVAAARQDAERIRTEAEGRAERTTARAEVAAEDILRRTDETVELRTAETTEQIRNRRAAADAAVRLAMLAADQRLVEMTRQVTDLADLAELRMIVVARLHGVRAALARTVPAVEETSEDQIPDQRAPVTGSLGTVPGP
jgi:cell division septum initiation protein DivIVA